MHLEDRDPVILKLLHLFLHKPADKCDLVLRKPDHCPLRRLMNRHYHFLDIKIFPCPVFFDYLDL